jgi:transposase
MAKSRRRRAARWSASEARSVIGDLERSGLPVAQYAGKHGLAIERLYRWKKRLSRAPARFTPRFTEVNLRPPARPAIEIELGGKDEALALFVSLLSQLATDHDKLQHQLRLMMKERFGRKSERIDPAQLRLFLDELGKAASAEDEARPVVAHVRRKAIERKGTKAVIPESIPREIVRLEPEEAERTCGCGAAKICIGCERSQVLELVPAQFKVIVYEREKYACKACEGEGIVVAPVPPKPIEGGLPGFGLMADVLIKKYAVGTPTEPGLGYFADYLGDLRS